VKFRLSELSVELMLSEVEFEVVVEVKFFAPNEASNELDVDVEVDSKVAMGEKSTLKLS
jgi:hypothetical protein